MMLKSYLTGPDQVSCDWWRAGHVTWILTSDWPMTGPRRAGAGDGAGGAPGVRLRLPPARPPGVPRPLQHHHLRVRLQRPAVRTGGGIKYFLDQIFFANTARGQVMPHPRPVTRYLPSPCLSLNPWSGIESLILSLHCTATAALFSRKSEKNDNKQQTLECEFLPLTVEIF